MDTYLDQENLNFKLALEITLAKLEKKVHILK